MSYALAQTILSRMNLSQALVHSTAVSAVAADLYQLSKVEDEGLEDGAAASRLSKLAGVYGYRGFEPGKPFAYADGVAVIPIHGTLINRFFGSWSFVTGYNFIRAQLNAALEDDDVETIVFDVNSYGGEVAGCFELAEEMREARTRKPLLAVVDSNCCSAAYALSSACTKVYVTPSGQAGSIGVIAMHVAIGRALDKIGMDVTIIAEGENKADGNPYEQLRPEVAEEIRADVAKTYGDFIELVVKNRPQLDSQAVRDTKSKSFRAEEALALNLIDAVRTPTEAVASFLAEMGSDEPADENEEPMATDKTETLDLDAARKEGAAAAKTRISAIMTADVAKGRPKLASHFAFNTDMSAEDAIAAMAVAEEEKAPESEPAAGDKKDEKSKPAEDNESDRDEDEDGGEPQAKGKGAFTRAMNKDGHPNLGAGNQGAGNQGKPSRAAAALATIGHSSAKPKATQH